ncbi:hypothetical protein [Thioalkalivibrio sp. XN279]|uniref:hypothetical protein n=1 Tax=Thioalkalivibrio sp. XN279 TaxID=2714953 RepID=UPI001408A9E8|nr:hypothetical protein [Thioalkalivibrio sp. XN279]NHA13551.1 hypothetical protein [Thioalkalivibrio sp. XN279]
MNKTFRRMMLVAVLVAGALVAGCAANVGVGLSVGVPIGDHGYMSMGTHRGR